MKRFLTSISLLAGLTIGAQTTQFLIHITKDQNLTGATWVNSMTVEYSPYGSNFNDTLDLTAPISNNTLAYPFTVNSSYSSLRILDARPTFRHARTIALGAWSVNPGELHVRGEWANAADTALYDVIIKENATGYMYNMYTENFFNISADTNYAPRFTIYFMPKADYVANNTSCFSSADGSIYAKSPAGNWSMDVYHDSVFMNTINVSGYDTLLTGLYQGAYQMIYKIDGVDYDTANVTIGGPAPMIASGTISDTAPAVGQSVTFSGNTTGGVSYFWDFGDGNTSPGSPVNYAYALAGTYTVTLTATSAAGCTGTATYVVTVSAFSLVGPPTTMSRTEEDPNAMARTSAQVQSQNNQAAITVRGDATIFQFSVYSMNGQQLFAGTAADNTFTYGTPGIYLIHILYSDGTAEAKQWYLN